MSRLTDNNSINTGKGLRALSPLLVFLAVYFVSSLVAGDFYAVPVSSAFLLASIYAVVISGGKVSERISVFSRGAGHPNILLMIWIFILAGAFAGTAKDMGAIDATVHATLSVVPAGMLYAGLFLTSCFISMSVGTSVGTIVALVPLASGIASESGIGIPFMVAIIVGGAFFGDNLSFISDTTIAATRAAGCGMKDKFKANIILVAPAVLAVTVIYLIQGHSLQLQPPSESAELLKILPYALIIVLAVLGVNVTAVLCIGIASVAIIGFLDHSFTWVSWLASIGNGIAGMSDLIIVTLLAGGLLELIRHNGGLDWLISRMTAHIRGPRGAQASIAALVALANVCTANNTIAIITVGGIAKDISDRFGVSPHRTASILDTFSCLVQGFLPYGAQLLMASSLAGVPSVSIIPFLYYPFLMGACAIMSILIYWRGRTVKNERISEEKC